MKIHLCSDLHLEFGYQELPGGEVLVLAGDIAEVRSISNHHHSTKLVANTPNHKFRCSEFFEFECAKYDKVFYVPGNHEPYHGHIYKTISSLKNLMPDNVTLMDNTTEEYKGVVFMGATLWTDLNKGDPITAMTLRSNMNDYRTITMKNPTNGSYHKLTPEYTRSLHLDTLKYFKSELPKYLDKPVVVITHHGPSFKSINEKYANDHIMNGGYVSNLDQFILDNPNITHWFHGHIHDPVTYEIGNTKITANPRGYASHEDTSVFDSKKYLEIVI